MSNAKDSIAAAIERRYGERLAPPALANLDALAVLNGRSVCRRYKPDPVPDAVLRLLCATALAAPTKSDLQQATLIRVADPAKRLAITSLLPGSPWLAGAPELFVFCADGWRFRRLFELRKVAFVNEHLDAFFNATVDAAIALGAFVGAAELAGLGTCPISQIRDHVARIDALLELPACRSGRYARSPSARAARSTAPWPRGSRAQAPPPAPPSREARAGRRSGRRDPGSG